MKKTMYMVVLLLLFNTSLYAWLPVFGQCGTIPKINSCPIIQVTDESILEGDNGTKKLNFDVKLTQDFPNGVPVYMATRNITANSSDYGSISGQDALVKTFITKNSIQTYSIDIYGDKTIEGDDTFETCFYSDPCEQKCVRGTIINDDFPVKPKISISNVSQKELSDGKKHDFVFNVTLDKASTKTVTVKYKTNNGTALSGEDYDALSLKILTFPAGVTSKPVIVKVMGDTKVENDEDFYLDLSSATNATLADSRAKGTIENDDSPKISISDVSQKELSDGKKHDFVFNVTLDKASTKTVTVKYKTNNGTALSGEDYDALSLKILTFPAGTTSKSVIVKVMGDTKIEDNEVFYVDLSSATNATLADSRGKGTIVNDDIENNDIENDAICYALTDNSNKLYKVTMRPNMDPLPIATTIDISHSFNGEGSAYLARNNTFYAFSGASDDVGPSDLYKINVDTGEVALVKSLLIPTLNGTVEGAEFYFNHTLNREVLYVISKENNSKLYAFDPNNNWELLEGYPKNTNTDLSSLAIDPQTGKGYAIDDYNYDNVKPKVYELNLETGATTHITTLQNLADAEGLAFASDGNLYVEDEGRDDLNGKKLYMVNLTTGALTPAAITNANGDIEGLSCNGTAMNVFYDFGDAPDKYSHVSHKISEKLYLGDNKPDGETDQQSSADATGDGEDDNDGVISLSTLTVGDSSYTVPVKLFNNTGEVAYITAWIDFNGNGTFEYAEALNTNNLQINSSNSIQTVNITWDNSTDGDTTAIDNAIVGKAIMRIRLTTSRILRCDDPHYKEGNGGEGDNYLVSPDGEVEDYEISIVDDLTENFTCNNEGIILTADGSTATSTNANTINLETTEYKYIKNFSDRHINAAGYNVVDNFVYGIGFKNSNHTTLDVIKIDKNYNTKVLNISGLPQGNSLYALGDVDFNNKLYVSTIQSENATSADYLRSLIVIDLDTKSIERVTPLIFPNDMNQIVAADYAFNPVDGMLYTVDSTLNQLIRIDPISGQVEKLGDIGDIGNAYSVISFFDLDGNFLFTNSGNTTIYKIDISNPNNINTKASVYINNLMLPASGDGAKCAYAKLPYKAFLGTFNIERTDSGDFNIGTDKRNAWYTQIVGRDFHYSVLFYDENQTKLKDINKVSLKLELINQDTNKTLYKTYAYIKDATTRVNVTAPTDLDALPATQKAIFRISYGVDANNSIVQQECTTFYKDCYEAATQIKTQTDYAKDNFSIRPESFKVNLRDPQNSSRSNISRMAAGYEYNLTINATQYNSNIPSLDYNKSLERSLTFVRPTPSSVCHDESNTTGIDLFNNGISSHQNFKQTNVGKYKLHILDKDWTKVDWDKKVPDCKLNNATTSQNGNLFSGCNIESPEDLFLSVDPYAFNVIFNMRNLPNSGHNDFIYMSQLSNANFKTSLQFQGEVTAVNLEGNATSNFTEGCVSEDSLVMFDANMTTDNGGNSSFIQTSMHNNQVREVVKISQMSLFNNENVDNATFSLIDNMNTPIEIGKDRFLNENNGTVFLDLRYNIQKHLSLTINPVRFIFNNINANSASSYSQVKGIDNYVPMGSQSLANVARNFYFTRISPDKKSYPRVAFEQNPTVRTPLNVDIFCDKNNTYCTQTEVTSHTDLTGLSRAQDGWYISTDHNTIQDGSVQQLMYDNVRLTVNPDNNISFVSGRNGLITTTFNNCNNANDTQIVSIVPDTELLYSKDPLNNGHPTYIVSCTDQNSSKLSGVGATGNIIDISANIRETSKIDW